jgi:hypothetical protein
MKLIGTILILSGIGVLTWQFIQVVFRERKDMSVIQSGWAANSQPKERYVVTRITLNYGTDCNDLLGLCNSLKNITDPKEFSIKVSQVLYELSTRTPLKVSNTGDVFESFEAADQDFDSLVSKCRQTFYSPIEVTDDTKPPIDTEVPKNFGKSENIIIDIVVLYEGELSAVENDLSLSAKGLESALSELSEAAEIGRVKAAAAFTLPLAGDDLTEDQVLINFPELLPLG